MKVCGIIKVGIVDLHKNNIEIMCNLYKNPTKSVALNKYATNNQNNPKFEVNYGTIYD